MLWSTDSLSDSVRWTFSDGMHHVRLVMLPSNGNLKGSAWGYNDTDSLPNRIGLIYAAKVSCEEDPAMREGVDS
jgi:hypothetical protein